MKLTMWSSDNAIFNVNGEGVERLILAFELALGDKTIFGYKVSKTKGLILYNYDSGTDVTKFPVPLRAEKIAEVAFEWLKSDEARETEMKGWDSNADHDGDNEMGWRVYTEDWGHVDGDWSCIAVKPAYLWFGK